MRYQWDHKYRPNVTESAITPHHPYLCGTFEESTYKCYGLNSIVYSETCACKKKWRDKRWS